MKCGSKIETKKSVEKDTNSYKKEIKKFIVITTPITTTQLTGLNSDPPVKNKDDKNLLGSPENKGGENQEEKNKELLQYFQGKRIYIEIMKNKENISEIYFNKIISYKITPYRKLGKNIDYIVYESGTMKTLKYAIKYSIKVVNPLWIGQKVVDHIFKPDEDYLINLNLSDLLSREMYEKELKTEAKKRKNNFNFSSEEPTFDNEFGDDFYDDNNNLDSKNSEKQSVVKTVKRKSKLNSEEPHKRIFLDDENNTVLESIKKNENNNLLSENKKITEFFPLAKTENETNETKPIKANNTQLKTTDNSKILFISYNIDLSCIDILRNFPQFEYRGELENKDDKTYMEMYNNSSVILVEYEKMVYNWKLYDFIFDKKTVVDLSEFLLTFVETESGKNIEKIINDLKEIDIANKFCFFNKSLKKKRRSELNTKLIIEKLEMNKKGGVKLINSFNFILNENISKDEYRILNKMLKFYLKANVIKLNKEKEHKNINENNVENNEIIQIKQESEENNGILIEINESNESISDNEEIEVKEEIYEHTYFITKCKNILKNQNKDIPFFECSISDKYIYDSFKEGKLLDLAEINILNKYKISE